MEIDTIIDSKPQVKHLFPFCNLPPMVGGRTFLYRCKHGIFQYIVIRPLTTFIALWASHLELVSMISNNLLIFPITSKQNYRAFRSLLQRQVLGQQGFDSFDWDGSGNGVFNPKTISIDWPTFFVSFRLCSCFFSCFLSSAAVTRFQIPTFICWSSTTSLKWYPDWFSSLTPLKCLIISPSFQPQTALYFLALFYTAYKRELGPMRPLSKFLCIKAVIFMSFLWATICLAIDRFRSRCFLINHFYFLPLYSQACLIAFLIEIGIIEDTSPANKRSTIDTTLQDFLICIEMFVAAIAHLFAFSHRFVFQLTNISNDK